MRVTGAKTSYYKRLRRYINDLNGLRHKQKLLLITKSPQIINGFSLGRRCAVIRQIYWF